MQPLIIACGALATELRAVLGQQGELADVTYLPANLHNTPDQIVPALQPLLADAVEAGRQVFVAYADCGTGGLLDRLLDDYPTVKRLPGAHCYEMFAGADTFAAMHAEQPGTFYLTDFLAKHFEPLVWQGLGLDRHPHLRSMYFGQYTRVVLLRQRPADESADDDAVLIAATDAAARLDLPLDVHDTGYHGLAEALVAGGAVSAVSVQQKVRS